MLIFNAWRFLEMRCTSGSLVHIISSKLVQVAFISVICCCSSDCSFSRTLCRPQTEYCVSYESKRAISFRVLMPFESLRNRQTVPCNIIDTFFNDSSWCIMLCPYLSTACDSVRTYSVRTSGVDNSFPTWHSRLNQGEGSWINKRELPLPTKVLL